MILLHFFWLFSFIFTHLHCSTKAQVTSAWSHIFWAYPLNNKHHGRHWGDPNFLFLFLRQLKPQNNKNQQLKQKYLVLSERGWRPQKALGNEQMTFCFVHPKRGCQFSLIYKLSLGLPEELAGALGDVSTLWVTVWRWHQKGITSLVQNVRQITIWRKHIWY